MAAYFSQNRNLSSRYLGFGHQVIVKAELVVEFLRWEGKEMGSGSPGHGHGTGSGERLA